MKDLSHGCTGRRANRHLVLATALQFALLMSFGLPVVAAPTIPQSALPGTPDPLALLRSTDTQNIISQVRPAGQSDNAAPATGDVGTPFTILGGSTAGTLSATPEDETGNSVRDRLLGIAPPSLDNAGASDAAGAAGASPEDARTLGTIARGLLNSSGAGQGVAGGGTTGGGAAGEQSSVSFIDDVIADLIVDVLNPDITADGLVTFSIVGFGNFALILMEETGGVFFIDLESGTAIKIFEEDSNALTTAVRRNAANTGSSAGPQGSSGAMQKVLRFLDEYIFPVLTSPITIAAFGLFAVIWLVFRISASRSGG